MLSVCYWKSLCQMMIVQYGQYTIYTVVNEYPQLFEITDVENKEDPVGTATKPVSVYCVIVNRHD